MDPISLIVAALVAGASAAARETATEAVKDAYHGFRALIQRRFADKPAAEVALAQHAEKPEVWEAPLRDALAEAGAGDDAAIVEAAQKLLAEADPEGTKQGIYVVAKGGDTRVGTFGRVTAEGDVGSVSIHIGEK